VVGDERRLTPAVIVAVLLYHRVREAQHTMLALQAVRPGNDPIHQTAQAIKAHRSSLPGHRPAPQAALGAAGRAARCQTPALVLLWLQASGRHPRSASGAAGTRPIGVRLDEIA